MEPSNNIKVTIVLEESAGGRDKVVISIENGSQLKLTTHQARSLATQLISVVNRAEVRGSLKRGPNLSDRRQAVTNDGGVFQPQFAK